MVLPLVCTLREDFILDVDPMEAVVVDASNRARTVLDTGMKYEHGCIQKYSSDLLDATNSLATECSLNGITRGVHGIKHCS